MTLSMQAISLIGRLHPEIFDILGTPTGVGGGLRSRFDEVALNPQPLPPRVKQAFVTGIEAGGELVRLAFTAEALRADLRIDVDDWCGTPPRIKVPWPPRHIGDEPDPHPWVLYNLGFALALEYGADTWVSSPGAAQLTAAHDAALAYVTKMTAQR